MKPIKKVFADRKLEEYQMIIKCQFSIEYKCTNSFQKKKSVTLALIVKRHMPIRALFMPVRM